MQNISRFEQLKYSDWEYPDLSILQEEKAQLFKKLKGVGGEGLKFVLGRDDQNNEFIQDLCEMPHLLVAGGPTTGKSQLLRNILVSYLFTKTPDQVRFILIDPYKVELFDFNGMPHLLTPVITDMRKVGNALKWVIDEMERRYTEFEKCKVRSIKGYNNNIGFSALPYIVVVIDELSEVYREDKTNIENLLIQFVKKGASAGCHMVVATQRPSSDIVSSDLKAGIPARIALRVNSRYESNAIIDTYGAEKLIEKGEFIYAHPSQQDNVHIKGFMIEQDEILSIVTNMMKALTEFDEENDLLTKISVGPNASPEASESLKYSEDDLFTQAARIVINARKGSSSILQRKLSVGYNRAARLMDELEKYRIVGPEKGSKPRDVLVSDLNGFSSVIKEGSIESIRSDKTKSKLPVGRSRTRDLILSFIIIILIYAVCRFCWVFYSMSN